MIMYNWACVYVCYSICVLIDLNMNSCERSLGHNKIQKNTYILIQKKQNVKIFCLVSHHLTMTLWENNVIADIFSHFPLWTEISEIKSWAAPSVIWKKYFGRKSRSSLSASERMLEIRLKIIKGSSVSHALHVPAPLIFFSHFLLCL